MNPTVSLCFALIALLSVDALTLQQVKDGEVFARDCIFKIGISPLAINRLRKGDFSRVDEKSHVSCPLFRATI